MAMDIVSLIKWMHDNASELGIDTKKIILFGCSGGGYVASAACSKLALANESHLIKIAILCQYMTPAYYLTEKREDMPRREVSDALYDAPFAARAYATDIDK